VKAIASLIFAASLAACAGNSEVTRVVDGRIINGRFIAPEAYEAFLDGAIAEDSGDLKAALWAYSEATKVDARDPEIWTRIGGVLCHLDLHDKKFEAEAMHAFERAIKIDPTYGHANVARAECKADRGEKTIAKGLVHDVDEDPNAIASQMFLVTEESHADSGKLSRDRLIALTLAHGTSAVAWRALATWSEVHGDHAMALEASMRNVQLDPSSRASSGDLAIAMSGEGELALARELAAVVVDAGVREGARVRDLLPLVALLAVDEAIVYGDGELARLRATRGHVALDEVAGRAYLLGAYAIARSIAGEVAAADPSSLGARFVLLATSDTTGAKGDRPRGQGSSPSPIASTPAATVASPSAIVAIVSRLSQDGARGAAITTILGPGASPQLASISGDTLLDHALADIAARDSSLEASLPLAAKIELAARNHTTPPSPVDANDAPLVDARHQLLAWSVLAPRNSATQALASRLAPSAPRDSLIAAALADRPRRENRLVVARETIAR
jgi:hypothetical protein